MATVTSRPPGLRGYDARWTDSTGTALVGPDGEMVQILRLTGDDDDGFSFVNPFNADTIDPTSRQIILLTAAKVGWPSYFGTATATPRGAVGTNSDPLAAVDAIREIPWAADAAYPGGVDIGTIFGGYDNVNNQEAGAILASHHSMLAYNVDAHGVIVGGSNHRISAGRATIVGGLENSIVGSNQFSAIVGGQDHVIYGANGNNAIVGGLLHQINAGSYSAAIGGSGHTISGNGNAALAGYQNVVDKAYAVVAGYRAKTLGSGLWQGASLTAVGDAQAVHTALSIRTTSASQANLGDSAGLQIVFETGKKSAFAGRVSVVGVDEATGAIASFETTFVAKWDGTTATVWAGGSSSTSRPLTQVVDEITVSAVPLILTDQSTLRCRVYGKAATNIKWSGVLTGAMASVTA